MDIDSATTANLNAIAVADADTNTSAPKSPDPDTETPTRIQQLLKPLSFTNGVLKRHHHHRYAPAPAPATTYKECLKNHAAAMGGHALDGCGEFMPSPTATAANPTSLKCAACGCHRNFHRRDPEPFPPPLASAATIEYQPHHRHHPPPPLSQRSPNSASPPPISSSYYPSAPHMLLALSGAGPAPGLNENNAMHVSQGGSSATRKRFRTKFSQSQKERMYEFAERVGWKIQKRDEDLVREFCGSVGIDKGVLKVWMHNNKNTLGKNKDANGGSGRVGNDVDDGENANHPPHHRHFENDNSALGGTNGSSSSS